MYRILIISLILILMYCLYKNNNNYEHMQSVTLCTASGEYGCYNDASNQPFTIANFKSSTAPSSNISLVKPFSYDLVQVNTTYSSPTISLDDYKAKYSSSYPTEAAIDDFDAKYKTFVNNYNTYLKVRNDKEYWGTIDKTLYPKASTLKILDDTIDSLQILLKQMLTSRPTYKTNI